MDVGPGGLLDLVRRKAEETRRECRAITAALFGGADAGLTDRQRAALSRLLRDLIARSDADIRARVPASDEAAELVNRPSPAGAEPTFAIMAESGAFENGALVEAVVHRLYQHQLERAVRTPSRDGWLGDGGEAEQDLAAVLGVAEGGPLWRAIADYQVECSGRTDAYGEPTLPAHGLSAALRTRLYWDCAAAVRETLLESGGSQGPQVDVALEKATRDALADGAPEGESRATALARGLREEGLLSAERLDAVLRAGEVALFEAGLGLMAGLGPGILRRLLYEPGGEGLAVLWRALEIPDPLFDGIWTLTRHARGRPLADPTAALARLRGFRERLTAENARAVLAFWRLSADYRDARFRVESRHGAGNAKGWG